MAGTRIAPMMAMMSASVQGQWGPQETKELISIRAEMERDSSSPSPSATGAGAKRSKALWDAVSFKMSELGFARTPDQCKCKWKNLLNRYKGKETSDPETGQQCPFFEELHALFTERAKSMQRLLLESEVGSPRSRKKMKRSSAGRSSDEFSENEEDKDNTDEEKPARSNQRKRKAEKTAPDKSSKAANTGFATNSATDVHGVLKEFFQQQLRMEKQWMEMMEQRAYKQQLFEQEWRQSMEKLERGRLMIEQAWRERDEQRRIREESRAERRDALLTTLLNNLLHDQNL